VILSQTETRRIQSQVGAVGCRSNDGKLKGRALEPGKSGAGKLEKEAGDPYQVRYVKRAREVLL